MTPNYYQAQELTEGHDKAAHLLLTAGVALVAAGRKPWVKACGLAALGGYLWVQRHAEKHRQSLVPELEVNLPPQTILALNALPYKHHHGAGNMAVQMGVNHLINASKGYEGSRHLLLGPSQRAGTEQETKILEAHQRLVEALAEHHSRVGGR